MSDIEIENMSLALPSMVAFNSYIDALKEGFYRGIAPIKTPEEIMAIEENPQAHFDELNDNTRREITAPSGEKFMTVPHETLWLTAGDIFIGEISFRHELNDFLKDFGGHIGYGIRPSLAGQGFATLGMELVKKRARAMGMDALMVTCSPENPASQRVIEKAGGVFRDISPNSHGYDTVCQRFWIEL